MVSDRLKTATQTLFEEASAYDQTLKLARNKGMLDYLCTRRISPTSYTREKLFSNMYRGRTTVFRDFPAPLVRRQRRNLVENIVEGIATADIDYRIRTRAGRHKQWSYYTVDTLARKWKNQRATINVTDLHIRDTNLENLIDTALLSRFNLFPRIDDSISWIEMMTLVVSSKGGFSDSHSDDPDGSNHCFTGRKLWLAWDTHDGMNHGLEDLDRQRIDGQCTFNLLTWLSLPSAHWFTVEPGQTLFMPGHLTHKVITLEPYLGVGSFYLALPNIIRTLSRWITYTPNWALPRSAAYRQAFYPRVLETAEREIAKIATRSAAFQKQWGLDFLARSLAYWCRYNDPEQIENLMAIDATRSFLKSLSKTLPGSVPRRLVA